jgi:hypothetical protein
VFARVALTWWLADSSSPLRRWFEAALPNVRHVQKDYRLSGPVTIQPPAECAHGTIGTAFDYRARYYFNVTNPDQFAAAVGAKRTGAVELYQEVATELTGFLKQVSPIGSRLGPDEEATLNRFCYALALFEECYRSRLWRNSPLAPLVLDGWVDDGVWWPLPGRGPRLAPLALGDCVDELLRVPPAEVIADLCALSFAFADAASDLIALRDRTVLSPAFRGSELVEGADADLIVDGCLYDLKTSKQPGLNRQTVYQLIGYVLLDFDDEYKIDSVGLYRARVPVAIRWELAELLATAGGPDVTLAGLRKDLKALLPRGRRQG